MTLTGHSEISHEHARLMIQRIAVIANKDKPSVIPVLDQLRAWGEEQKIVIKTEPGEAAYPDAEDCGESRARDLREWFSDCELGITLGGDGTLLYSARILAPLSVPVLPVNLGDLGFHTQVTAGALLDALSKICVGEFETEPRLMLEARLDRTDTAAQTRALLALNDIVISRSAWGRMVHLRLEVNGRQASDVFADGLIIASPTGSSAYNYAAHGPVLDPSLDAIVLNAICAHRMNFSPVVLPSSAEVVIDFHPRKPSEEAHVLVDGWHWCSVSHEHRLKISRAPMYLPLIVLEHDFFTKLREKLAWGGLN